MDTIFKALADPARRTLLDSLKSQDGQTLQELQSQLEMTRFGVMKHLSVLEEAGLIVTKKVGRFKHHYLNAVPLQEAIDRWIDPFRAKPATRAVLDLKAKLEGGPAVAPKPDFVTQTYIRCTQDALWAALTDPEALAAYNHAADKILRDGDTLTYYAPDGRHLLITTETHLTPKSRIEASFEPHWAPNIPPSRFVYRIAPQGDHCQLTLEHYALTAAVEDIQSGWGRTLSGLKTWLETGQAAKFRPAAE